MVFNIVRVVALDMRHDSQYSECCYQEAAVLSVWDKEVRNTGILCGPSGRSHKILGFQLVLVLSEEGK